MGERGEGFGPHSGLSLVLITGWLCAHLGPPGEKERPPGTRSAWLENRKVNLAGWGRGSRGILQFRPLGLMKTHLSTAMIFTGWLCVLGQAACPLCASAFSPVDGAAVTILQVKRLPFLTLSLRISCHCPVTLQGPPHGTERTGWALPFVTQGAWPELPQSGSLWAGTSVLGDLGWRISKEERGRRRGEGGGVVVVLVWHWSVRAEVTAHGGLEIVVVGRLSECARLCVRLCARIPTRD